MPFSKKENKILEILNSDRRWWYGLEIKEASDGVLSRGTIYVHLNRLEEQEFVESRLENDEEFNPYHPEQPRRRLYHITRGGIRRLVESEEETSGFSIKTLLPQPA